MKIRIKSVLITFVLLGTLLFVTACGAKPTPYDDNNAEGYTVSVKYDANGGTFTTNTTVIVDSYNVSKMQANSNGKVELALVAPDNSVRGNDQFTAVKNGYFLAGWYSERTESTDSEGNVVYTYANKWDFDKGLLEVDTTKTYTSEEPVITLYAAWVPMFEVNFYSLDGGDLIGNYTFNPTVGKDIMVPAWSEKTGAMEMFNFPEKPGYTFKAAYYDDQGTEAVTDKVVHPGKVNEENGTAVNPVLNLYVDWTEGEWYHIYNVEQFQNNASMNGCYVLHEDLDFTDTYWPSSLMYGNFNGTIIGNGHTIKNVNIEQTNMGKANVGLFGVLTDKSRIENVTFENVTFTIKAGVRSAGTSFGLLAGTITSKASLEGVQVLTSKLQIDTASYFATEDYAIGLLYGSGDAHGIDFSGITCTVTGENPEKLEVAVDGNEVTVTRK